MLKSKDVLVDPDNAWKSASRIKAPYNAAIRLCLQSLKHERAFKLLNQMKKDGIFPSAATFSVSSTPDSGAQLAGLEYQVQSPCGAQRESAYSRSIRRPREALEAELPSVLPTPRSTQIERCPRS